MSHPIAAAPRSDTVAKMPGHWLLAKMGKRVLRPGGRVLTGRLLGELQIEPIDDVVTDLCSCLADHLPAYSHASWRANGGQQTAAGSESP